ncbi:MULTISPECIES: type II toxin-antitoxin system PemK/MazF family toxin [Clostridiaceae]|uniref:mRNA interferase n=1 Tax=Clostridium facile TaxID=2763035 RepID=A0ABR7IPT8_9CLOT|nr:MULTISPECIES: type II toxin-antitoxin system PemK/MazF family toxin [Clostridiaceae]MBC5787079.1 type II toxin-antitoxin system PemK/MazF family toxin [Clostridium facile]
MIKEVKRGEIYFADLEPTRGSEQGGCRPVLIIQNDKGNHYSPTTIIAAITSRRGSHLATHVYIPKGHLNRKSFVMLEQIRTVDKMRLINLMSTLDEHTMKKVEEALLISIGLLPSE